MTPQELSNASDWLRKVRDVVRAPPRPTCSNGERIIDRQTIPGITGGALDSKEGEPGPLLIQGDHGPVEFRKVAITPAK